MEEAGPFSHSDQIRHKVGHSLAQGQGYSGTINKTILKESQVHVCVFVLAFSPYTSARSDATLCHSHLRLNGGCAVINE